MMQLESRPTVFPPHKKMPSLNLGYITQKLGAQTLNEVQQPFETQVPIVGFGHYYGSDSEEENHEVELYLKEKRLCNSSMASSLQNNNNNIVAVSCKPLRPLEDSSNSTENIQNQTQTDRHSSEGELTVYDRPPPEKRKFSQVCSWGIVTPDLSSSDDEVRELCLKNSPIQFGSSPPKHVPRFFRRFADSNNLTIAACPGTPSSLSVCESSSAQPRKRHRHSHTIERHYLQSGRCVDFEKMQEKLTTKRFTSQGITSSRGARVVRIRSITHSRVPPRLLCDPAVYSFKSLSSINPMTPVEEPAVAAF